VEADKAVRLLDRPSPR